MCCPLVILGGDNRLLPQPPPAAPLILVNSAAANGSGVTSLYFLGLSAAFLPEVTNPAIVPLNVSFLGDQYPSECPLWVWESFKWIFGGSAQQNGLSHPCANLLFSPSLKKKKNRIDFKKFRVSHASWEGGKENAGCSKKKRKDQGFDVFF